MNDVQVRAAIILVPLLLMVLVCWRWVAIRPNLETWVCAIVLSLVAVAWVVGIVLA